MRVFARGLVVFSLLVAALAVGCAEVPSSAPGPVVPVACVSNLSGSDGDAWSLPWELQVSPTPIHSGQTFAASFDGTAVFPDWYLELGLQFFGGVAVTEGVLVDLKATVRVRRGAAQSGPPVVLVPDEDKYPYRCETGGRTCDPEHDLEGGGNTDCDGDANNPCRRFVALPISGDCDPGGRCDDLGKTFQCHRVGWCVTEADFRIELQATGGAGNDGVGHYRADEEGEVLFGFDDTNVEKRDGGVNDGTWIIPVPAYEDPTGPVGIRATFLNVPVAWECAMGIDCDDPIFGVGCSGQQSSRVPDEALISFQIQPEAP